MKKTALFAGTAVAVIVVAVLLALRAAGKGNASGFLGPGSLVADVNLTLEILLVLGLTAGMALARGGRIETHRINQTVWVLVNCALVVSVMVGSAGALIALKSNRPMRVSTTSLPVPPR